MYNIKSSNKRKFLIYYCMGLFEIILIGVSLSADAFAVALSKGLSLQKYKLNYSLIVGLYFGIFQALMPLIGYIFSKNLGVFLERIDHYIAFIILLIIGINMIKDKEETLDDDFNIKTMTLLAIGTSIDALAIGITFSFLKVNILLSISIIGIITFILSYLGTLIGYKFKDKTKIPSKKIGGIILIIIGLKILLTHLGIL